MSSIDEAISGHLPYMSGEDNKKITQAIEDISRNAMIRKEIMLKRSEGMTVKAACRELSKKVNLDAEYIEKLYYKR